MRENDKKIRCNKGHTSSFAHLGLKTPTLQPLRNTAVMETRASPVLTKTVRSIVALSSCTLWRTRAVLRFLDSLPRAVHIGAVVAAIHIVLIWRKFVSCRFLVLLSGRLRLRDYLLPRKQNNG